MTIAAAISSLRKSVLKVAQHRMARRIGVTQAALSRYECGEREPSFGECVRIAKRYPGVAFVIDAAGVRLTYSPDQ